MIDKPGGKSHRSHGRGLSARLALWAALLSTAAILSPRIAAAQSKSPGFAINRFEPSVPGSDWFSLESLDFRGSPRLGVSLWGDYAHKPLVLFDENDKETSAIIKGQMFLHVGIGVNLADRFRLGANIPLAVLQTGSGVTNGGRMFAAPSGFSAGDLRLSADARLVGDYGDGAILALGASVFVPTGKKEQYTGDGSVRAAPHLLLAGDIGALVYAVRAGFQYRNGVDKMVFQGAGVGSEVFGGAALGIRVAEGVLIGPELYASTVISAGNAFKARTSPMELLFGGHFTVADDWRLGAGIAPGLTQGLGEPALRVVGQIMYFPAVPPPDTDGDRIVDAEDACPTVPGIRTGNPRTHGCPPPPSDRDKDGVLDRDDACPDEPGVRTDNPKTNGCPPAAPDRDKDGVLDRDDACPDEPGVKTDDPKTNGCPPPPDRDKDGILDRDDACADIPGMKTDDPKTNGCADKDGDTILDPVDACPDQPGPKDPDPTKNGCPIARVEKGQIRILEQVKFKFNSHIILPESDYILEAVKKILEEHPEIQKLRVEGHTDNRGAAAYNKKLSDRRAGSVANWLVQHGTERGRIESHGYGSERPIANNKTEEGRAQNRRVEFHIVEPAVDRAQP